MLITATASDGNTYRLSYGTNGANQVCDIRFDLNGKDLTDEYEHTALWIELWNKANAHHKQCTAQPTDTAPTVNPEQLAKLHAQQDECIHAILDAVPAPLTSQVFEDMASLLAYTNCISNLYWAELGLTGPSLVTPPCPAEAESTAFAHAATSAQTAEVPA